MTTSAMASLPSNDLHHLRLSNSLLDSLCQHIQSQTATTIQGMGLSVFGGLPPRVLVTGSSGYIGAAVVMSLRALGVATTGLDLRAGPYTDVVASVSDQEVAKVAVNGCGGIIHTAALHAPHDKTHSEEQFREVNVVGSRYILEAGHSEAGCRGMVHASTTSLLITEAVKATEAEGKVTWLDEKDGHQETPRNKYGRSKQEAERICREYCNTSQTRMGVAVLRVPRCFPEDLLEGSDLSLANVKANELLGRRSALVDVVAALLLALVRSTANPGFLLLTLCAPWPWAGREGKDIASSEDLATWVRKQRPAACQAYEKLGWKMPQSIGRVYDSSAAVQVLGWKPLWTFDTMVEALGDDDGRGVSREDALLGRY